MTDWLENIRQSAQNDPAIAESLRGCPIWHQVQKLPADRLDSPSLMAHLSAHLLFARGKHLIDPADEALVEAELRYVYDDLNNPALLAARRKDPQLRAQKAPGGVPFGPEDRGCTGGEIREELWVESLRAYMQYPGYIKTVANELARVIRKVWNRNPATNGTIMFN